MGDKQTTINQTITFSGTGLHTGLRVNMSICPAEANHGIVFQRTDMEGQPMIQALADYVTDTSRGTTIEKNGARVSTIEHVLAAIWCSDIDNALVMIDGPETPIMDGSAKPYVDEIDKVGIKELDAERTYYTVSEKISFSIPEKKVSIEVYPDDQFSLSVNVDFDSKVIGRQFANMNGLSDFKHVASCRTFVFLHELAPLIRKNLIKGGDLDNAIIIVENPISKEEEDYLKKLFNKPDIKVEKSGYLNHLELRHQNEIARHKLLDLCGDLALVGTRIKGKVFAVRPGHYANTEFAKEIRKVIKKDSAKPPYKYDANAKPVYDINAIKAILPHRPPFLLVDKILYIDETRVVGIKNITMNEPFFVGHFPNQPVMPGVLQVEAMAQCGGILALSTLPDPENYSTYFLKIDQVKFRRQVVPGDTLMFVLELTEPIRRGIVSMKSSAYVGDQLATEALLMAQIAKNSK